MDRDSKPTAELGSTALALEPELAEALNEVIAASKRRSHPLGKAEFVSLRERLFKIGARVIEHLDRIRVHLPTSCPEHALLRCRCAQPNARGALRRGM
jgi:hypothetical protein